jgi:plasmid maintenance system killer protein
MVIRFATSKMARACSTDRLMRTQWGDPIARKLQQRLTELEVFDSLADATSLPAIRCHEMTGDRKGQIAVDLVHPHRLLFRPDHDPLPAKPDGGLDWTQVTAVVVIEVVDYH